MAIIRSTAGVAFLLAAIAVAASGCRLVAKTAKLPMDAVSAVVPVSKPDQIDAALLQTEIQRFSDEYSSQTIIALDSYAKIADTTEARHQVLTWKLAVSFASVSIASGPNSIANLLDFLSLATVTRIALEEDLSKTRNAAALQPWLEVSRRLETNAWNLSNGVLKPAQQQEMRQIIRRWWDANPNAHLTFLARPQEFTSLIRNASDAPANSSSVLSLVGLDPTAGLDPAVREVTRTRLFAERALFAAQRTPFLLRWQIELLSEQLLSGPQLSATLTNVGELSKSADRLSRATESISQTAAQLPDRVTAERKAVLDALETQEGHLRELSTEVTRTLSAGDEMSTSLRSTIVAFDALMKRFGVGEPPSGPPNTNSPPFNILDYAHTADRLSLMAKELDTLIKDASGTVDSPALKQRVQELGAASDRAKADAKSVLNHAFLLGACLVLLTFACGLLYRRITSRRPRN